MYVKKRKCIVYPSDVSKHSSNPIKTIFHLMIPNGEIWHYLAAKKLSALLRGITSKLRGDFYRFNCLDSFETRKKQRESYKKVRKNRNLWNIIMPSEDTETLKANQYQKSGKVPFIIYAGLEC